MILSVQQDDKECMKTILNGIDSCPIGVSADSCPAGAPWMRE